MVVSRAENAYPALVIDHIGGKRISIRHTSDGIVIVSRRAELELDATEWFELLTLVAALRRAVDFNGAYDQGGEGIAGD